MVEALADTRMQDSTPSNVTRFHDARTCQPGKADVLVQSMIRQSVLLNPAAARRVWALWVPGLSTFVGKISRSGARTRVFRIVCADS